MSPSDNLPFWTVEEWEEAKRIMSDEEYAIALEELITMWRNRGEDGFIEDFEPWEPGL